MVSCPLYLCVQMKTELLLAGDGPSNLQQSVHPVSAKGSAHPCESSPVVLCIVSLIPIPFYVPQKITALFILPLFWSGQKGILCCAVEDLIREDKPSSLTLGLV